MVCTEPIELQFFQLFQTKDDDDGHQKTNQYYYLQFQKSVIKPHQSNALFWSLQQSLRTCSELHKEEDEDHQDFMFVTKTE